MNSPAGCNIALAGQFDSKPPASASRLNLILVVVAVSFQEPLPHGYAFLASHALHPDISPRH